MIYFVRDSISEFVKVGFSENPWLRLSKLQSDCPGELTLLGVIDGDQVIEAALHVRCAGQRVRGEWFRNEGAVAEAIASAMDPARPGRPINPKTALINELREATGVQETVARGWVDRGRVPARYMALVADAGVFTILQLCDFACENDHRSNRICLIETRRQMLEVA